MRLGVAISTRNRRHLFENTLARWIEHLPEDAALVVVDDASDVPVPDFPNGTVIRNDYQRGVAQTKNRGIAELISLDCDELFLADDDVYPISPDWWRPYVDSVEPHLSFQWAGRRKHSPCRVVHDDGEHFSVTTPRGCLLYANRKVIDTVGGMDPAFGLYGCEHIDWSQRIHASCLTRWPFADVVGSQQLWFAHDQISNTFNSTFPLAERRRMVEANKGLLQRNRYSLFVPYEEEP